MHATRLHQSYEQLPRAEFASLGQGNVAYVRPIDGDEDEKWAIFSADGTKLALLGSRDAAIAAIVQNDMTPLLVH
jgi:hypothetical protein